MKITKHEYTFKNAPEYVLVAEYSIGVCFDSYRPSHDGNSVNLFDGTSLVATVCGRAAMDDFNAQMEALA